MEARSILNSLPDVTNPDNIGRFYRPPYYILKTIKSFEPREIGHFVAGLFSESLRDKIFGKDVEKSHSYYSNKQLLSSQTKKKLKILEEKKLELKRAFELLAESCKYGNLDALYTKAELYFYGNYTHPQDFDQSFQHYRRVADISGNATAQFMLGVMHSTGMFGTVPQDQALAHLYYHFAAQGGDNRAKMAMGFRLMHGIATPSNFTLAARYYKEVADKAYENFMDGPPGGRHLKQYSWLLSDAQGGLYGKGASRSPPSKRYPLLPASSSQTFGMAFRYLKYLALLEDSVAPANYALANLFYDGDIVIDPNYEMAAKYAKECLKETTGNPKFKSIHGLCSGFLGLRYLRGEGVDQNFNIAMRLFKQGIKYDDFVSMNGLGLMYLEGLGVEKNEMEAAALFKRAGSYGPAHYNLARIYLRRGDLPNAFLQLDIASKRNNIPALYHQGMLLYNGSVGKMSESTPYFQLVSERVHDLHSSLRWAHKRYDEGDYGSAILGFLLAAEEGYQEAQLNLAYMLDDENQYFSFKKFFPHLFGFKVEMKDSNTQEKLSAPENEHTFSGSYLNHDQQDYSPSDLTNYTTWKQQKDFLAFIYWTRSAKQYNIDALVKAGDYFLKGIGVRPNPTEAASRYQVAADYASSLARWNLGWMYENGIGVDQDFHLAKRYYDYAASNDMDAYFPVQLSLLKLRLRSSWNALWKSPSDHKHNTLSEEESAQEKSIIVDADNPLDGKNDRPSSFREGLKLFWKKWKERGGLNPELNDERENDNVNVNNLDNPDEDVNALNEDEEIEELSDFESLLFFIVVGIIGMVMFYRFIQQGYNEARRAINNRNR